MESWFHPLKVKHSLLAHMMKDIFASPKFFIVESLIIYKIINLRVAFIKN